MGRITGWLVQSTQTVASQVAVQVATTLAVAAITGAILGHQSSTRAPEAAGGPARPEAIDERFGKSPVDGKSLIDAAFTTEGVRVRQAYPMEFGAVFGPSPARPYIALAGAEWSTPPLPEPAASRKPRPMMAALPPQRPAPEAAVQPAEAAATQVTARAAEERAQVFGVALPGFVPRGETVVRTVVGWGERAAGLADIF